MSDTRTPGQRAYEAFICVRDCGFPWYVLSDKERSEWEAAASAVLAPQADQAAAAWRDKTFNGGWRYWDEDLRPPEALKVDPLFLAPPSTAALEEALRRMVEIGEIDWRGFGPSSEFHAALIQARSALAAHQENPNG